MCLCVRMCAQSNKKKPHTGERVPAFFSFGRREFAGSSIPGVVRVLTYTNLHAVLRGGRVFELVHGLQHVQRHVAHAQRVKASHRWSSSHGHVCVPDGFYLSCQ